MLHWGVWEGELVLQWVLLHFGFVHIPWTKMTQPKGDGVSNNGVVEYASVPGIRVMNCFGTVPDTSFDGLHASYPILDE